MIWSRVSRASAAMASKTNGYWWPGIKESVAKVLKARISQENSVNTMTADALAPCIARTPAAMVFETDAPQSLTTSWYMASAHHLLKSQEQYHFYHWPDVRSTAWLLIPGLVSKRHKQPIYWELKALTSKKGKSMKALEPQEYKKVKIPNKVIMRISIISSMVPRICGSIVFRLIIQNSSLGICCRIALRWIPHSVATSNHRD